MVSMNSYIEIGDYVFRNQCHSVKITSSRTHVGDKAVIQLPNIKGLLDKSITTGMPVVIKLGYDDDLYTEFTGYVSAVKPKTPIEIECEDEMWQLRQSPIKSKGWVAVSLKELIKYIVPTATINAFAITLSPFRIESTVLSRAEALDKLKKEYGFDVYYRGKELYAGLAYQQHVGEVVYHFQKNAIMDDLTFLRKDDVKVKIKAISYTPDNKKTEVEVGDKNGETHTLHFFNKTKEELAQLAKSKINMMKYEGYRGKFKAKGLPRPQHGMICHLYDDHYPEREGQYFIDGVETTYSGSQGFSRTIRLGRKSGVNLIEV
jgi:hypothetical protein